MDFIFVTIVWKFTNKKTTNCYSLFVPPFSLLGGCVFFYYVCRGFIKSLPYMLSIFRMVMSMWVLGLLQFLGMWIQRVWTIACDMHSHVQVIKKDQVLGEKTKHKTIPSLIKQIILNSHSWKFNSKFWVLKTKKIVCCKRSTWEPYM